MEKNYPQEILKTFPEAKTKELPLRDVFGRGLHTLRLSVTDRCSFRCQYCMPNLGQRYTFLKKSECLSVAEFTRLVKLLTSLGIRKVRLTGGEPLAYPHLFELIRNLSAIEAIEDLALTTNGSLLAEQARKLKHAGLQRLTVSLDTLNPEAFRKIRSHRNDLTQILNGIDTAATAGFDSIKINCVIQRRINEDSVFDLINYFRGTPHIVRFIEYMDVGTKPAWHPEMVLANSTIKDLISRRYPLKPIAPLNTGDVAKRYQFLDGKGEIGFISAVSEPFCGQCDRLRLSSDGKIYTCLFAGEGTDLKGLIRKGASDQEIQSIILNVWQTRADKYSENRSLFRALQENIQKVEMHQIGG